MLLVDIEKRWFILWREVNEWLQKLMSPAGVLNWKRSIFIVMTNKFVQWLKNSYNQWNKSLFIPRGLNKKKLLILMFFILLSERKGFSCEKNCYVWFVSGYTFASDITPITCLKILELLTRPKCNSLSSNCTYIYKFLRRIVESFTISFSYLFKINVKNARVHICNRVDWSHVCMSRRYMKQIDQLKHNLSLN